MFCKSCNCNSSIATRIGFAVCRIDVSKIELPELTTRCLVYVDDIPDQFNVGVAYEDPYGNQVD